MSLPWPEQMLIHHQEHVKKRLLRLHHQLIHLISSSFPFHPSYLWLGFVQQQEGTGHWVLSRAEVSSPAWWGPGQSLSASGSSPEPYMDVGVGKCCFPLWATTAPSPILYFQTLPIAGPSASVPTYASTKHRHPSNSKKPVIRPIIKHVVGTGSR